MRVEVTLDCTDLERTAAFWQVALAGEINHIIEGRYISLRGAGLVLSLQKVKEPKVSKNRMHLDLLVEDLEGEIGRLLELGAARIADHKEFGQVWTIMADPEGNEFCVATD